MWNTYVVQSTEYAYQPSVEISKHVLKKLPKTHIHKPQL